ncbi:hypothetical protein GCM10023322_21540 [Rugosimonospora acidiphila]|uniref:Ricin B lectin domain-containing protein n=1 Tax=Rugosimonospora acidiphila TaxID=556531 RepID=A0ABP9RQ54_9ACTN
MRLRTLLRNRLSMTAALAVVAMGALSLPAAPASAAPIYWSFRNTFTGKCLTAGVSNGRTGKAYVATCTYGASQEWDWVNGVKGDEELRSKATGLCLDTDNKSATNTVWTSSCGLFSDGEYYSYSHDLRSDLGTHLRTDPHDASAVYATRSKATDGAYFAWTGSTN